MLADVPTPRTAAMPSDTGLRSDAHDDNVCGDDVKRHPGEHTASDPTSFAGRLNRLFDTIRPPGRGPLRDAEVRRELQARGQQMSAPYLSQLRTGSRTNPQDQTVRQLAELFGVRPEYFTGQDPAYTRLMDAELQWLDLAHDPAVRQVTSALLTLPPDVREEVLRAAESRHRTAD